MSPSSLVQWTHNLPHLDQTFGEVNSSFQIPSATLEDSYSESLITLPVIIAGAYLHTVQSYAYISTYIY